MKAIDMTVAETILTQLGGSGRLAAMIGAKNFVGDTNELQFRFGAGAKNGANHVVITLDPSDTYTVRFVKIGRAPMFEVSEKGETSMVYGDQLRSVFERATGFYLNL